MHGFTELTRRRGLALVEDGSHAHGARRQGHRVGTFGSTAGFSLQQSKLLTCGEGGVAVAASQETGRRMQQLRANGREYDKSLRTLIDGHGAMGDNYLLGEMPAAIALTNLAHLDEENSLRHAAAQRLSAGLAHIDGVHPPVHPSGDEPGYHKYTVALDLPSFSDAPIKTLAAAVSAEVGARCEVLDAPLSSNALYAPATSPRFKSRSDQLRVTADVHPAASAAADRCLAFRHHLLLASNAHLDSLVEAVAKVQRHAGTLSRRPPCARLDVA
ncbi:MAG: DegT/DnrJ/EryC1/StrS family aminotransferase [Streptosporangiaceae bacterium]